MRRQSARQLFGNSEQLRGWHVANLPDKYPVLRRPIGGWGAREWRRKALNGPLAAFWVVGSAASCNLMLEIVRLFASVL